MEGTREESAIRRIEAAIGRIEAAAETLAVHPGSPDGSHAEFRSEVAATLRDLDRLIESLEQ